MSQWTTPNLPGYVDNSQKVMSKRQTLTYSAAGMGVSYSNPADNAPSYAIRGAKFDKSVVRNSAKAAAEQRQYLSSIARGEGPANLSTSPVVTFTAYWKEGMSTGNFNHRIRIFKFSMDLDDGEVTISEQKEANSGLPQGVFLKKQKIPNGRGGTLMPSDCVVGKDVSIFARKFHIFACDDVSRAILKRHGIQCPPDESRPNDPAEVAASQRLAAATGSAGNASFKKYNEAQLGAAVEATKKLGNFLEFSEHPPLRFFAVWRDTKLYGKLNRYTVDFYLEDRTFHIRDIIEDNSGTDQFHNVYKRATIAKPGGYRIDSNAIGLQKDNTPIYDVTDLYIGNSLQVFGKKLLITDCNQICRDFYSQQARANPNNFKEQPSKVVLPEDRPAPPPKKQTPVPYMSGVVTFGSEEDSQQSCESLHPVHIKDDPEKVKSNQNHALSFGARMISTKPEDKGRHFNVKFYLFDSTVAVYETARANSGIVPGKFLRRTRLKNPTTGSYFTPTDFFVGAELTINVFRFELVDLDSFTMNYAINRPTQFKWADIESLLKRMKQKCQEGNAVIGGKSYDTAEGNISEADFRTFLRSSCNMDLSEAICCASFFLKNQELDFAELRRFNQVQDKDLNRLISADNCDTVLEDAQLDPGTRLIKRTFARVSEGFRDDTLSFVAICDSNMDEMMNLNKAKFIKSLETAKYRSNIPYNSDDITRMAQYFYPGGKEMLGVKDLYKFLFKRV